MSQRDDLAALERAMWTFETRADRDWMDAHLADDCLEYGQSGRTYDRAAILDAPTEPFRTELNDIAVSWLSDDVALVTYRSSAWFDHDRVGPVVANRSSVWVHTDTGWRLRFHQGTPTAVSTGTRIGLVTLVVRDYDEAIRFFVEALGFELVEDSPATTNDGRPKRWVVVAPPGGSGTGLLLAEADGDRQAERVGDQTGGRVALFLYVDDFAVRYERMRAHGVEFTSEPRREPYGTVAVFRDIAGNLWDLIEPAG